MVVNDNDSDEEEEEVDEKDGLMGRKLIIPLVNDGKTITQDVF